MVRSANDSSNKNESESRRSWATMMCPKKRARPINNRNGTSYPTRDVQCSIYTTFSVRGVSIHINVQETRAKHKRAWARLVLPLPTPSRKRSDGTVHRSLHYTQRQHMRSWDKSVSSDASMLPGSCKASQHRPPVKTTTEAGGGWGDFQSINQSPRPNAKDTAAVCRVRRCNVLKKNKKNGWGKRRPCSCSPHPSHTIT